MAETENHLEMKREAEDRELHRMAKVHDFLEIWQGSQNLHATQNESHAQNKQMTAVGYDSDTEEIVKESWSNFQPDGVAAFKLSERLQLPPALSAKDLPGGRSQELNVSQIKRIDCHGAKSDEDIAPESISDTQIWLDQNGDLVNPNQSEDDWEANNESNIELDNGLEDPESPEQLDDSATPNVPRLI